MSRVNAQQPSPSVGEAAMQAILRALADPSRYLVLRQLAQCGAGVPCSTIRENVEITPATLSHHMKELRDAGLIEGRREGRNMRYTLKRELLEAFQQQLRLDLLAL